MRCEVCQGTGFADCERLTDGGEWHHGVILCPNCVGGQTNCCDGICEQPDETPLAENHESKT